MPSPVVIRGGPREFMFILMPILDGSETKGVDQGADDGTGGSKGQISGDGAASSGDDINSPRRTDTVVEITDSDDSRDKGVDANAVSGKRSATDVAMDDSDEAPLTQTKHQRRSPDVAGAGDASAKDTFEDTRGSNDKGGDTEIGKGNSDHGTDIGNIKHDAATGGHMTVEGTGSSPWPHDRQPDSWAFNASITDGAPPGAPPPLHAPAPHLGSIGLQAAPLGEIGLQAAQLGEIGLQAAPLAEIGLQAAPLAEIGIQQLGSQAASSRDEVANLTQLPNDPMRTNEPASLSQLISKLTDIYNQAQGNTKLTAVQNAYFNKQAEDDDKTKDRFLEEAHATGVVPSRGALGNRFQTFLDANPDERKKYETTKGNIAKADFRKRWFDEEWVKYKKRRTVVENMAESWADFGTYEPFEVIAGKESGTGITSSGAEAALNICLSCIKLGGYWCKYNWQSKRMEYLYMKSGYKYKFEKQYNEITEMMETNAAIPTVPTAQPTPAAPMTIAGGGTASAAPAVLEGRDNVVDPTKKRNIENVTPPQPTPRAKKMPRGKAKAKAGTAQTGDVDGKTTDAEQEKERIKQLKKTQKANMECAQTSISEYGQTVTQANLILDNIKSLPEWKWANNSEGVSGLQESLNALVSAAMGSQFIKEILITDIAKVKSQMAEETFDDKIASVTPALESPLKKLKAEITCLQNMHREKQRLANI
ncbi:unnamed protein product [Prorocentrum cordatum]|uniref:Uncharacterized protein n=1 Tax=Prorocentrum cordatum TaxID=2364126 RepID=A0ABN9VD60_9DINO|nr:unnamed protein product [Polarella glacialis]